MEMGGIGQKNDVFGGIEMPDNQITREYALQGVKFMLVFGQAEERSAFSSELTQGDRMVLIVRHEKGKLVAKT